MKKYVLNRILVAIIFLMYAVSIFPIIRGEKPFEQTDVVLYITVSIVTVGVAAFFNRNKMKQQYQEAKKEKDERYIKNRNTFSYFFLIGLGIATPPVMVILRNMGVVHIEIGHLALIFVIISFIYMMGIDIVNKKR